MPTNTSIIKLRFKTAPTDDGRPPEEHEFSAKEYEVVKQTALEWVHNWSGWAKIVGDPSIFGALPDTYGGSATPDANGDYELFACTHDPAECPVCKKFRAKMHAAVNEPSLFS